MNSNKVFTNIQLPQHVQTMIKNSNSVPIKAFEQTISKPNFNSNFNKSFNNNKRSSDDDDALGDDLDMLLDDDSTKSEPSHKNEVTNSQPKNQATQTKKAESNKHSSAEDDLYFE